jgi:hypothetical protein
MGERAARQVALVTLRRAIGERSPRGGRGRRSAPSASKVQEHRGRVSCACGASRHIEPEALARIAVGHLCIRDRMTAIALYLAAGQTELKRQDQ